MKNKKSDLFLISGTSTGIGHALTLHFAGRGHLVLAGVRTKKDFAKFNNVEGVVPFILDVTDAEDLAKVPALIAKYLKGRQRLVLVNNAGIAVHGPWELIIAADLEQQMQINILGPIRLTQKCLPTLRKTKGHIFNISSVSGLFASPFLGPYSVSKHALESFSDSLRREMLKFGVAVTSINPGPVATPIWQKGLDNPNRVSLQKNPTYGAVLKKFEQNVKNVASRAVDVSAVVNAVDRAYRAKFPPARTIVATLGTQAIVRMGQFLPDRWVDQLVKRF